MKIEDHNGYLELERTDVAEFPYLRIAAVIETSSGKFCGENNAVFYGGGEAGKAQLNRLRSFELDEARIELTEGCWLEVRRFRRGNMEVRFQIVVVRSGTETSLSGLIAVEGEYAVQFVEALRKQIA